MPLILAGGVERIRTMISSIVISSWTHFDNLMSPHQQIERGDHNGNSMRSFQT